MRARSNVARAKGEGGDEAAADHRPHLEHGVDVDAVHVVVARTVVETLEALDRPAARRDQHRRGEFEGSSAMPRSPINPMAHTTAMSAVTSGRTRPWTVRNAW